MILLDSSFLCAWYNQRDVHHPAAREVMRRFLAGEWGRGVVLEYVFLEVVTVLLARRGREAAFEASRRLMEAREVEVFPCSDLFLGAVDAFRSQPGRELSFTDAAIVAAADRLGIQPVATFDEGLREIEGLEVVP